MRGGYCCGHSSLLCFSTSWVCHSSCLSHFTPGPILQSCSPGLHLQSTPLHKPLDSLLSVPDRTTHYCGNDTRLALVLVLPRSHSLVFCSFLSTTQLCFPLPAVIRIPHSSSPASLLPRQPHPIPASSPHSINPFFLQLNFVSVCSWVQHRLTITPNPLSNVLLPSFFILG